MSEHIRRKKREQGNKRERKITARRKPTEWLIR